MTLSGRPLLDTRHDQTLFIGRERALARILSAIRRDLNVIITGGSGMGKTSLARAVGYALRTGEDNIRPAYVSGGALASAGDLLSAVVAATTGEPGPDPSVPSSVLLSAARESVGAHLSHGAGSAPVVIVDDLDGSVGNIAFGTLRDEIWALGIRWIVVTRDDQIGELLMPPADVFFEIRIDLEPLTPDETYELLHRRAPDLAESLLGEPVDEGAAIDGNPRRLLGLARELVTNPDLDPRRVHAAYNESFRLASSLGRSESMLFAELHVLGRASASDPELQKRMGWTRPRLVQVLGQLENANLITSDLVSSGQGRPRKVYRPLFATASAAP